MVLAAVASVALGLVATNALSSAGADRPEASAQTEPATEGVAADEGEGTDAESTLSMAIAALVAVAVVTAAVTFAFWRYTRPAKVEVAPRRPLLPKAAPVDGDLAPDTATALFTELEDPESEQVGSASSGVGDRRPSANGVEESGAVPSPAMAAAAAVGTEWAALHVGEPITASRLFGAQAVAVEAAPHPPVAAVEFDAGDPLASSLLYSTGVIDSIGVPTPEARADGPSHPSLSQVRIDDEPGDTA